MMFDCGANMGYWSVLASSVAFGGHPVVAIEAARGNVELLAINARANNERFRILHRAVAPTSGMIVKLWGSAHVSHSLRDDWLPDSKDRYEQVETISLDDVAAHYLPERNRPILIKLDVEGAEAEAMIGARRLIGEGALVVYEDHGIETTHAATRHVLSIGGMQIWTRGLDGQLIRLDNIEQVAAVKSDRNRGYNFFAYRDGSPWARLFQ